MDTWARWNKIYTMYKAGMRWNLESKSIVLVPTDFIFETNPTAEKGVNMEGYVPPFQLVAFW